jgi:TonB dependent receptor/Carboxypeptidase regulatory-like domain
MAPPSLTVLLLAVFTATAWAFPQTQDLKGEVVNAKGLPIAGAICTLKGNRLPGEGVEVITGERGGFAFPGLVAGNYDLVCAAVDHLPVEHKDLEVAPPTSVSVRVVLPDAVVVKEKVEVHEAAPTIPQQSSAPTARLSSKELMALPLVQQEFKAALPLVPGVVRTPDGKINIKGSVESQGMLLVDSAEMVDPITGSYSIDLPIDAVESVEVYKTPYNAEFGHFSGGLTSLLTKAPSSQWDFEVNDLVPTARIESGHIVGIADDSHRLSFTGPLAGTRLTMSESFAYIMNKQPVRGLPWPDNETKREGINSFTNFQTVFSSQHFATFNVHVFPVRQQFADINSLVPQTASSDYGQSGFSLGGADHYLFASGGLLTSLVQYIRFSSYGHGQGPADMEVTPNGWGGNFFNSYNRASNQGEAQETFQFPHKAWHGQHELKLGGDAIYRSYDGTSLSRPVDVLRANGSLAERIEFAPAGLLKASDGEEGLFVQDHWALRERLALDLGLRVSGQTLGKAAVVAPRFGVVYAPGSSARTILRGGIGVFYDRAPLLAGSFTSNPTRVVTLFDAQGMPIGQPVTFQNAYGIIGKQGIQVVPSGQDLDSTPYNITWNAELDRELHSHVLLRLSYLSSRTFDQFVVGPQRLPGTNPLLLLTNNGSSQYNEFESTVRVRAGEHADLSFSYVHSQARGDLNTLSQIFVPFEQPVIRQNFFADLPSSVPNRLVTWGRFEVPWKITVSPVLDWHTGFPYSAVDALQNYVGQPNSLRFPTFFAVDLKLSKDFRIPFVPWVRDHTLRGALAIYNLTDHLNPRDVYYSIDSPYFGHFAGPQHIMFDTFLDVLF